MPNTTSPTTLAQAPSAESVELPDYDWQTQSRGSALIVGRYTSGSIQTFDHKGNPKDSKSDQND
jgi:hypothetical protein